MKYTIDEVVEMYNSYISYILGTEDTLSFQDFLRIEKTFEEDPSYVDDTNLF